MQQNFIRQVEGFFSRWSRKSFAVFNSLGKVIKISGLSVVIASVFLPDNVVAQEENSKQSNSEYYLEEVELVESQELQALEVPSRVISVVSSRDLKFAPIETVQDILNNISQLDLRQRGNNDVQADISIRGGTFDQVLVLLNGINITNPQTGHHNLNLPISFDQIERVEILNGAASLGFGANAYSGIVNIVTKSSSSNSASIKAVAGQYGLNNLGASVNLVGKSIKHFLAINRDASNGYMPNTDFKRVSAYYNGKSLFNNSFLQWQLGYSDKGFGAQSFYTAKYPNQFEQTRSGLASLNYQSFGKVSSSSNMYWNFHTDRFELFRNNENADSWYANHNYHLTNVAGANSKVNFASVLGKTSIGVDFRYEHIYSNVLGEATSKTRDAWFDKDGFYNKEASRLNSSVSIEQNYKYKKISAIIAVMLNKNSAYDKAVNFYPGVDLNYHITNNFTAKGSFNKTLRLPTFTDLYYAGPANIGNPNLIPEEAVNFDIGVNYQKGIFSASLTSFNSFGVNSIDWVRANSTDKWQPQNLTETKTFGVDLNTRLSFSKLEGRDAFVKNIFLQFTFMDKKIESNLSSAYVNDYLKYKFVLGLDHKIFGNIGASWKYRFQQRQGSYMLWDAVNNVDILTPYGDYQLLDLRLNWSKNDWLIFVDVKNIFDTQVVDYGNVLQPGRWISLGVKKEFSF